MKRYLSAIVLFFIFLVIYYIGSFTRIPFADCVGFVLSVENGEFETTATATSHFLYTNTAILIKNLIGLNAIEASRFLVVTSGAATVSVIYLTVKSIAKAEWAAITAAIVFGFSFSFWRNAEIVEVYTYNSLWVSLFFYSMTKVFTEKKSVHIILSSLFLGISLWVHIQNILMIPALLLFLFYFKEEKKYVYSSLTLFIILFSSLFILNIAQGLPFKSPYSSDQGTWVQDSLKQTPVQLIKDLLLSFTYLVYNFNIFIFFGVAGIALLYRLNKKMFYVFFVAALLVYGFSTFYIVSDNYVFFIPFNIIFALSIGYGLSSAKYASFKKVSWICLFIPLGYVLCYNIALSTEKGKEAHAFKKYKGGLNYYLLPWMNNNAGILEFTIDKKTAPEPIHWMTFSALEYIKVLKSKGYTEKQIRKL
ncbi:protein O-mannosyl-transferase family [Chryseobacterium joostei]|uniref:protein O-mannosyl-transferase family n=1 Tax=Chryseobacterium joostei TaxID=112234 RepID=UPI003D140BFA